jgi:hypothetical protein
LALAIIYGDKADVGKPVDVVLWNEKSQKSTLLSGEEIQFNIDQIKGAITNPVVFKLTGLSTSVIDVNEGENFAVYPNPFSTHAYIRYFILKPSDVSPIISNAVGTEKEERLSELYLATFFLNQVAIIQKAADNQRLW